MAFTLGNGKRCDVRGSFYGLLSWKKQYVSLGVIVQVVVSTEVHTKSPGRAKEKGWRRADPGTPETIIKILYWIELEFIRVSIYHDSEEHWYFQSANPSRCEACMAVR